MSEDNKRWHFDTIPFFALLYVAFWNWFGFDRYFYTDKAMNTMVNKVGVYSISNKNKPE